MARNVVRKIKHFLSWQLVRALLWHTRKMSWDAASELGAKIGAIAFLVTRKHRKSTVRNIKIGLGNTLSLTERYRLAYRVFQNLGRSLMETIKIQDISPEEIRHIVIDSDFESRVKESFRHGKSVMMITAHYSNWELFAAWAAQIAPTTVLAKSNPNTRLQSLIDGNRKRLNIEVIDRDDPRAVRKIRDIAKKGGNFLGILMDQDTRVASIYSPFLGKIARTPSAPAQIAIRNWFDVYCGFLFRRWDGRFELRLKGPLPIQKRGSKKEDIQANTDMFNALIGEQILEDPSQWVWIHRRWKHQPGAKRDA